MLRLFVSIAIVAVITIAMVSKGISLEMSLFAGFMAGCLFMLWTISSPLREPD